MWLLSTNGKYTLVEYSITDRPPYAILSHVWGDGEVTMSDMQKDIEGAKTKPGFLKIEKCCEIARRERIKWIWIDTCCIDKASSAELSEAINSMYRWYKDAKICYVYLSDVSGDEDPAAGGSSFRSSRWFTRGWTLQELIAPPVLTFLDKNWKSLGTKRSLVATLWELTKIDRGVLLHEKLPGDVGIARRMSWAANRKTKRVEDRAYSLMGIFNVHMPTIYGEGEHAFVRLQLEIIRHSPDQSIFAWGTARSYQEFLDNISSLSYGVKGTPDTYRCLLASSPDMFAGCENIEPVQIHSFANDLSVTIPSPHYTHTNYGIHVHLPLYRMKSSPMCFALLACKDSYKNDMIALLVTPKKNSPNQYHVGLYREPCEIEAYGQHPSFRVFRIPQKEPGNKRYLTSLAVVEMFLHSHNANPQHSHTPGMWTALQFLQRLRNPPERPGSFAFTLDGWLLKNMLKAGFTPGGLGEDQTQPSWVPLEAWRNEHGSLHLTIAQKPKQSQHAVVLFRGPHEEAFALAVGVTGAGLPWAEVVIKGSPGLSAEAWGGAAHEAASKIWEQYAGVDSRIEDLGLNKWQGARQFGESGTRAVNAVFKPWRTRGSTIQYTVGLELVGSIFTKRHTPSFLNFGHDSGIADDTPSDSELTESSFEFEGSERTTDVESAMT